MIYVSVAGLVLIFVYLGALTVTGRYFPWTKIQDDERRPGQF